jgi:hypothetical protein
MFVMETQLLCQAIFVMQELGVHHKHGLTQELGVHHKYGLKQELGVHQKNSLKQELAVHQKNGLTAELLKILKVSELHKLQYSWQQKTKPEITKNLNHQFNLNNIGDCSFC